MTNKASHRQSLPVGSNAPKHLIIYANAASLFDHSSGAARSIRALLEQLASCGCQVHAVMGCTSDCEAGFKTSQLTWEKHRSDDVSAHGKLQRFTEEGVSYSLIATEHWCRRYLAADEQELVYREYQAIISNSADKNRPVTLLSWGNLLLEESIFNTARHAGAKTCFYLANPTYKGKSNLPLKEASLVITDSNATRELYSTEYGDKLLVLPKCIEKPKRERSAAERHQENSIAFVNPTVEKGLEAFLQIASSIDRAGLGTRFVIADAAKCLGANLRRIGKNHTAITTSTRITEGMTDTDELLWGLTAVMLPSIWHESGSRLIHECHLRGIPIIAFDSGGSKELLSEFQSDLIKSPEVYFDRNGTPRLKNWNEAEYCSRIKELITSIGNYQSHSDAIRKSAAKLIDNNTIAPITLLEALC